MEIAASESITTNIYLAGNTHWNWLAAGAQQINLLVAHGTPNRRWLASFPQGEGRINRRFGGTV
jgi:hypothetical protein